MQGRLVKVVVRLLVIHLDALTIAVPVVKTSRSLVKVQHPMRGVPESEHQMCGRVVPCRARTQPRQRLGVVRFHAVPVDVAYRLVPPRA
eukprot:804709-Rhodomonas_salina.2